jgi:hypothetical protein
MQMSGADFNIMEAGLFFTGRGGFFSLVKAKPVILCHCSSTRGGLHKSIQWSDIPDPTHALQSTTGSRPDHSQHIKGTGMAGQIVVWQ